jgi:serine/threonine-protein kinase
MTGRPIASRLARGSKPFSMAGAVLLFAGAVRAEPDDTAPLRAQALFDEARALMKEGRYSEACPKLAESQRLDPGGGTLLNLGICHARAGLTATAHTELRAALAQAETDNRADRVKTAQHQLDELSPKLSWLRIQAASDITTLGVRIEIDGVELSHADFGNELPIDPGVHEVKATAPGHLPWSTRVQIAPALDHQSVDVPALEPEPRPLPAAPPPPAAVAGAVAVAPKRAPPETSAASSGTPSWIGYATGGAGIVALGVGTYFGVRAVTLKNRSDKYCDDAGNCENPDAVKDFNAGKQAALLADVFVGVGIVGVGVGTCLLLFSPEKTSSDTAVRVSLGATPMGGGVTARGRF